MKIKKEYKAKIIHTLKFYNLLPARINFLLKEIEEINFNDGVAGIDYSGDGIKTNSIQNVVEHTALENIKNVELLRKDIEKTEKKLSRLNGAINALNPIEKKIIEMKFLEENQWGNIANAINYTDRTCRTKLNNATNKLAFILYGEKALYNK